MVNIQGVSKHFGDYKAVDEVSFEVEEGDTFAIIGGSGSGKTTLLRLINRLIPLDEGEVFINGKNSKSFAPVRLRRILGYVIQSVGLFPHYTVEENIAIVPRLLKWKEQTIRDRAAELLSMLGLEPGAYAGRYPHELSGGQQQRVGIARALAANPPIILMDEPFGSLDPLTRVDIQREFSELKAKLQQTVIWVTHDVRSAFQLSDKIALMHRGRCHQVGTPRELLLHPADEYVRTFLKDTKKELKLSLLTLEDIRPFLPAGQLQRVAESRETRLPLNWDTALSEIINTSAEADEQVIIYGEERDSPVQTTVDTLLRAYFSNRKAIEHE